MIEIYNNKFIREVNPNEDFMRDYQRERIIIEEEKKYDLKRFEQVENDILKLKLYDF